LLPYCQRLLPAIQIAFILFFYFTTQSPFLRAPVAILGQWPDALTGFEEEYSFIYGNPMKVCGGECKYPAPQQQC
jgi:hypothetical protein